ncbi:MAG: DUF4198 domain-containing protein [Candidatus Accumulibacter sp.]|jgi:hypothetical protein|nr:DUF4198 domain-containing protein [Accumulibacter sp.]
MKQKTRTLYALIATFVLCPAAEAHQIWLEQPEGENAVIRFGEFGDNLREASPGLLDNFGAPTATLFAQGKSKPLTPTKTATGFALPTRLKAGESLTAEDARFPIRAFQRDGREIRNWYWPAARFITDDAAQEPQLSFDITPTGKAGEFRLTFKGQPLARTEAHIVVQSGWNKSARSNAEGLVRFDLPWQGQYVVEASHVDRRPGERDGEKYDGINYVTTLTLVRRDGVAPLPAGPAARPNPGKPAQ